MTKIGKVLIFALLGAGLFGAGLSFIKKEVGKPKTIKDSRRVFRVSPGEGALAIGRRLERREIVKSRYLFLFAAFQGGRYRRLKAGVYEISPALTPLEIAGKMEEGEVAKVKVTVPEGLRTGEVEERLTEALEKDIDLDSYEASRFEKRFPFLEGVPEGKGLEGFLFPDTYFLAPLEGEMVVVEKMLSNFSQKAAPLVRKGDREIFDTIKMASLLEKEVRELEDKRVAAGILWKRRRAGIPLQVDATITYLTGRKSVRISAEEKKIESLYNTYRHPGLPPGPICNPGLESIRAAVNPKKTDYWYYLTTPEGKMIPSRTLRQQNINKAKYLSS